jgi:hypothetical protein
MIICSIIGGLGNQLFQIFATISLGIDLNEEFIFPYSEVVGNRKTYWNTFFQYIKMNTIKNLPNIDIIYKEKEFKYKSLQKKIKKYNENSNTKICINGYFQSYKYFINNYEKIINLIRLNDSINNLKLKINNKYNFVNTISLHFRLGDYKNLEGFHPVTKIDYYSDSIKWIIDKTNKNDYTILYFCESDDINIVNDNINKLKNIFGSINFIRFCDNSYNPYNHVNYEDYEEMLAMSLCTHNIIANSTFSWWGAYFNKNVSKIVTYPSIWFGPNLSHNDTTDLFPSEWVKI